MTIKQIFNKSEFIGSLIGTETFGLKIFILVDGFQNVVPLYINSIPSQNINTKIYLRIEDAVNKLIYLSKNVRKLICNELWNQYNWICENTAPIDNHLAGSPIEANMKNYGIFDIDILVNNTSLYDIEVMIYNFENEDGDLYWNLNYRSDWIGDGFLQCTISENTLVSSTIYH